MDESRAYEIPSAWVFPPKSPTDDWEMELGGPGVVAVNKTTGVAMTASRQFRADLYEKGYQFDSYDLVVVKVRDIRRSAAALLALRMCETDLSYESGVVWRFPRELTLVDLRKRLERLPCIFPAVSLDQGLDTLEAAREALAFETVVVFCSPQRTRF